MPKNCFQSRFTKTRAVSGFSFEAIHCARSSRVSCWPSAGFGPGRKCGSAGCTISPVSIIQLPRGRMRTVRGVSECTETSTLGMAFSSVSSSPFAASRALRSVASRGVTLRYSSSIFAFLRRGAEEERQRGDRLQLAGEFRDLRRRQFRLPLELLLEQAGQRRVQLRLRRGERFRQLGALLLLLRRGERQPRLARADDRLLDVREKRAERIEVARGDRVELVIVALRAADRRRRARRCSPRARDRSACAARNPSPARRLPRSRGAAD